MALDIQHTFWSAFFGTFRSTRSPIPIPKPFPPLKNRRTWEDPGGRAEGNRASKDAHLDEYGYIYATIPANTDKGKCAPVICFCSTWILRRIAGGRTVETHHPSTF